MRYQTVPMRFLRVISICGDLCPDVGVQCPNRPVGESSVDAAE